MKNIYTFFYTVNDFEKNKLDLINLDFMTNEKHNEFDEVFEYLDALMVEPSEKTINNILAVLNSDIQ